MTNEELVRKAIITATDIASAGKLNDEQAMTFIDFVIDVTELKGNVRVARFRNESLNIDKIGVGQRVSVPKEEAKDPALRRGISTSKVTLTPREVMTPFEIGDNFAELNIEGEAVEDTVVRLMATQTANDVEELMINGDTLGAARLESDLIDGGSATQVIKDSFMALFAGWLRLADSGNVYDAASANVSNKVWSGIIKAMPEKFRRTRRDLRFLASMDMEQTWREKVSSRATAAGDNALTSNGAIVVYGIPLVAVPLLSSEPWVVEHKVIGAAPATVSLRYKGIGTTLYATLSTLDKTPTTPYIENTDYTVDRTAGTFTTVAGQAMAAGGTFKLTYKSAGQIMLTNYQNLILGIGRDVRIETDRDIFKGTNQFAITTKIAVQIEETSAIVKGINVGME